MSQRKQHNQEKIANALTQLILAMHDPEDFAGRFSGIVNEIGGNSGIREFLSNPAINAEGRNAALHDLFQSAGADACHLALMLVERGMLNELSTLRDMVMNELAANSQRITGEVVSAAPLSEDILRNIRDEVVRITGHEVFLKARVDKGLLGGIRIQVGDMIIDGSIDYQIDMLQQALTGGDA